MDVADKSSTLSPERLLDFSAKVARSALRIIERERLRMRSLWRFSENAITDTSSEPILNRDKSSETAGLASSFEPANSLRS